MKPGPLICAALLAAAAVYRRQRLSQAAQVIAALGCLGLAAFGSGLIHLPQLELMIRDGARALGVYTYALVGAFAFLETGAGVGLVAPGELVVILGGVSAGQGEIALIPLVAIVWVCAVAGDLTSYLLGRRLGRDFLVRRGSAIGITVGRLEQVERFFDAHGGKTIIVGRFVGLVRALAPFIAGASRMSPGRFVAYTTVAAGLWSTTFCLLGYAFWQSLDQLVAITKRGSVALGVVIAIGFVVIAAYRRARTRPETDSRRPEGRAGEVDSRDGPPKVTQQDTASRSGRAGRVGEARHPVRAHAARERERPSALEAVLAQDCVDAGAMRPLPHIERLVGLLGHRFLGCDERLLPAGAGDDHDALLVSHHNVARADLHTTAPDRAIERLDCGLGPGDGDHSPGEDGKAHLTRFGQIADHPVENESRDAATLGDGADIPAGQCVVHVA